MTPRPADTDQTPRYECGESRGCHNSAVAKLRLACVHEHVYTGLACAPHLAQVRAKRSIWCHVCARCSQPHSCQMQILPAPGGVR